ncbi:MAG: FtsQ-type POTRA domain-containing protein [Rhodoluna sp.]
MKRPHSRPNSAGLPRAPKSESAKPQKPKRNTAQIKSAKFKSSNIKVTKIKPPSNPKRIVRSKVETNRALKTARSIQKREIRRFTGYSRARRAVVVTVVSAFSALLLLVLASIFTPMLAVETIDVSGTNRLSQKSVINALQNQIGKPLPAVSGSDIKAALKPFALIESFTIVSLPPHTLQIKIIERQPIGVVNVNGTDYLYDPAGVKVGFASGQEKLPVIDISGDPSKSKLFQAAIEVLMALPADLLTNVSVIHAQSKDDVTLTLRGYAGQRIIWGDQSESILKSRVLAALIANQKSTDRVTYDVSAPNSPVVKYGNF